MRALPSGCCRNDSAHGCSHETQSNGDPVFPFPSPPENATSPLRSSASSCYSAAPKVMLGALALHRCQRSEAGREPPNNNDRWRQGQRAQMRQIPIAAAIFRNFGSCCSTGSIAISSPSARSADDPLEINWKSTLLNPAWISSLCAANATVGRLSNAAEAAARAM